MTMDRVAWTSDDDGRLRQLWAMDLPRKDVARHMKRSYCSVRARAHRLKLECREFWSSDRETQLAQLWADGTSDAAIAEMFGVTRSAVKNKAQRMKLPLRETVSRPAAVVPRRKWSWRPGGDPARRVAPSFTVARVPTDIPEPDTIPVTLAERTGCAWPVNNGGPYLFCNAPAENTYCDHHRARMTRP